jgi:hypothetical protein
MNLQTISKEQLESIQSELNAVAQGDTAENFTNSTKSRGRPQSRTTKYIIQHFQVTNDPCPIDVTDADEEKIRQFKGSVATAGKNLGKKLKVKIEVTSDGMTLATISIR